MKKNVGNTDRFVRVMIGIILLIIFMSGIVNDSAWKWGLFGVCAILIVTSFANFCPLYALIGKSTCTVRKKK